MNTYICKVCAYPCILTTESSCRAIEERQTCPYMPLDTEWTKQLSEAERNKKNKQLAGLRHDRRIALVQVDDMDERIEALKKELAQ